MADWSLPALTSTYTNTLTEIKNRDIDLALQFDGTTSTNLAVGTIRWDSTANRWKKWNGSTWAELAAIYALTALSTTGAATIGTTLGVTGQTTLATATATTPATADNNANIATTAFVKAQGYATLASPTFTGTVTIPTGASIAGYLTTAAAAAAYAPLASPNFSGSPVLPTGSTISGSLINYAETINAIGSTSAATTINLANGNFVTAILAANTTFTFTTGMTSGAIAFTLLLSNDATAGRTIVWPTSVKWPGGSIPPRTTTASKTDVYTFITVNNGANWYGNVAIYNYS